MRFKSFLHAAKGIALMFATQHNARIHFVATAAVVFLGFFLKVSSLEWCLLTLAIGFVFAAELFNTSIEILCNWSHPGFSDKIKQVKDLAAGGVLAAAATSVVIGAIVFIPKISGIL